MTSSRHAFVRSPAGIVCEPIAAAVTPDPIQPITAVADSLVLARDVGAGRAIRIVDKFAIDRTDDYLHKESQRDRNLLVARLTAGAHAAPRLDRTRQGYRGRCGSSRP